MTDTARIHRESKASRTLLVGLYVWAILLSMEVFDVIDIDVSPGDNLPELSWTHVLAHGQNVVALLALAAAGARSWYVMRHPNGE